MKQITLITVLLAILVCASCNTSKKTINATEDTTTSKATTKAEMAKEEVKEVVVEKTEMKKEAVEEKVEMTKEKMTDSDEKKTVMDAVSKMEAPGMIKFEAANDRYAADGTFKNWKFKSVNMTGDDIETLTASILIDLTSISEKNQKLTDHLKAPDFFNIAMFKEATLDIMNVKSAGDNMYTADMKLNMKGLTQDMKSEFTVTSMNPLHVKGTASVNRVLFGLGGEIGVGEFVKVSYDTDIPK